MSQPAFSSLFSHQLHWNSNLLLICFPTSCNHFLQCCPLFLYLPSPIYPSSFTLNAISLEKLFSIPNLNSLNVVTTRFMCFDSGSAFICSCVIGDDNGFRKLTNFKMRKCYPLFRKIEENSIINFAHSGIANRTLM